MLIAVLVLMAGIIVAWIYLEVQWRRQDRKREARRRRGWLVDREAECCMCDEGEADTATGPPDTPGGLTG